MHVLEPFFLYFAFALLGVVALYLFRRRPKKMRVSTLLFFKSLAREHQESAWLRRLKRLLSFLLSAAVCLFAILALSRLIVAPKESDMQTLVLLMDRSASMEAVDDAGRTRLQDSIDDLRTRLAGVDPAVRIVVVAYDARPEILVPATRNRREVWRALTALQTRPIAGDADRALALARQLAEIELPGRIWHCTDRPESLTVLPDVDEDETPVTAKTAEGEKTEEAETLPAASDAVQVVTCAVPLADAVNVGITGFGIRPDPMSKGMCEVFLEVVATGKPVEAKLAMRIDKNLVQDRPLSLEPGEPQSLTVSVEAGEGQTLSFRVVAEGDALAYDDEVHARIPPAEPLRVHWVTMNPNPFIKLALQTLDESEVAVFLIEPDKWKNSEKADVTIFDDWVPEAWPQEGGVLVINPPSALEPIRGVRAVGGAPLSDLRVTDRSHPLLYGVAHQRIRLLQTTVLEADESLRPLWVGPAGPVMLAGETGGQRFTVMAFDPARSERLPLMASFPLLFGNCIYWLSALDQAQDRMGVVRTGVLREAEGETLTWRHPDPIAPREESKALVNQWFEFDRVGLYSTSAGEHWNAAMLSLGETELPLADRDEAALESGGSLFSGDLTRPLLWAVFCVLLLESFLFHRHAVY